ncbi:unnamed protein product [Phytophthora fragariaefolia]|uniref:Unnamed protein product n=1 Tax=Phytophthora fragariaefolia TaxID=1490495 RepID=A0A9W6XGS2_9STRA|nr:unnamed protein product [Phytophthora fragariaefolia]
MAKESTSILQTQAEQRNRLLDEYFVSTKFALPIWGIKSTLEQLTGANLHGLLNQINYSFRDQVIFKEFLDDECRVKAYGVIVGDSVLGTRLGNLFPCFLELESHVFVAGRHLEKTMGVFARFLLKQLHEAASSATAFSSLSPDDAAIYHGCVACGEITITPKASTELSSGSAAPTMWGIQRIMESRSAFISAVKTALISNSTITLNQFDFVPVPNAKQGFVCQVERFFFFHFTMEVENKVTVRGGKRSETNQSFVFGSRSLGSGIFFDSEGAVEIASRCRANTQSEPEDKERNKRSHKKKLLTISDTGDTVSEVRPRAGFAGILQNSVDELRRMKLGNSIFREYVNDLVGCFGYNIGCLANAHQLMANILDHPRCSVATVAVVRVSYMHLKEWMERFLEELNLFPPTSVLYPARSLLYHFNCQIEAASEMRDDQQINDFVEALQRMDNLLLIAVCTAFSDFIGYVRSMTSQTDQEATNTLVDMLQEGCLSEVDVIGALEAAVEERKYPPAILSEAVFAQAVVDSCLDVALESAVMNTVAVHLPPNPFIDISANLQVFALRQLVWNSEMKEMEQPIVNKVSTRPDLFIIEGTTLCSVNARLLRLVGSASIPNLQQWLIDHNVLHEGTYKPAKSSYSATIMQTILIFHPLLFAQSFLRGTEDLSGLNEFNVIEHYVLEGKEIDQAQYFFLEAIRTDIRRITVANGSVQNSRENKYWQVQVELQALDPIGRVLSALDLSHMTTGDGINEFIEETSHAPILLQLVLHIAEERSRGGSNTLTVHKVTKLYTFHYHSTDDPDAADSTTFLPPQLLFRISEYGVFFSRENALLYFKGINVQTPEVPQNSWTPYASDAYRIDDRFLIYENEVVHEHTKFPSPGQVYRNTRATASDNIFLFGQEQTIQWLLGALQAKVHQVMASKSRKEASSTTLLAATLFDTFYRSILQIITQVEKLVIPLNVQLQFMDKVSEISSALRKYVNCWKSIQHQSEGELRFEREQQNKVLPEIASLTPREDQTTLMVDLVKNLRTAWVVVIFFRFSYQRAFFANYDNNKEGSRNAELKSSSQSKSR